MSTVGVVNTKEADGERIQRGAVEGRGTRDGGVRRVRDERSEAARKGASGTKICPVIEGQEQGRGRTIAEGGGG